MELSKSTQNKLFTFGYTAKGVVYSLIGIFAIATVIGAARNGANGPRAVIEWIGTNPFGQVLLFLIGLGLISYSAWRWYQAVKDTEDEGHDASGAVKRIGWAVSGTGYAVLAVYAFKLAFGEGGGDGGTSKQGVIAGILSESWGPWVVGLIALIVAGVGVYQLYRAITNRHMDGVSNWGLASEERETFKTTGQVGLTARFIVYSIISFFLFRAAIMDDPSQFRGIGGSLSFIENQTWGAYLLALVGLGLLAYGTFMFIRARYERV